MAGALLTAIGLGFRYERQVLTEFDLELGPGTIAVLVGLNGAGKTTALRLLSGQLAPTEGRVRVAGGDPLRAAVRRGVFFMPEVTDLPGHLNARELVTFHLDLYGRPRPGKAAVLEILERCGLEDAKRKQLSRFSKGMRRRAELACLLAIDPEVWILDEPQSGLDPDGLRLLRELCREARERRRAVVMATHALSDVKALADHVILLEGGRTVFAGDRQMLIDRAGSREFVVAGGGEEFDKAFADLARSHGATVSAPEVAVEALEALFFSGGSRGGTDRP